MIDVIQGAWSQIGPSTIAGIISGVVVAILIATAPKIRQLMSHSWVGGAIAGVVAVLLLSDLLRGPRGEAGSAVLEEGFVVAFAGLDCPPGWDEFRAARDRFIVGASGRRPVTPDQNGDGEPEYRLGGAEEVTLTVEQIPKHNHLPSDGDQVEAQTDEVFRYAVGDVSMVSSGGSWGLDIDQLESVGGDQPHENMPPYIALYFCTPEI